MDDGSFGRNLFIIFVLVLGTGFILFWVVVAKLFLSGVKTVSKTWKEGQEEAQEPAVQPVTKKVRVKEKYRPSKVFKISMAILGGIIVLFTLFIVIGSS